MWRKTIALALSLLVIAAIFAGCSGETTAAPAEGSAAAPAGESAAPAAPAATEAAAPSGDAKTLKVLCWDLGAEGALPLADNYWSEWIQTEFGDKNNINIEWVIMPRWEEVQMLNVWMASQEAPDIIYTYDFNLVVNYLNQGGLIDLTDLLAEYGQNYRALTTDAVLEYGVFDGRQMVLPTLRSVPGIVGASIRGDWLDKVGMPVPTTTEEWYNTMVAFKEQDPGGLGELNIPVGMGMQEISFGYFNMLYSFVDPNLTLKDRTLTYPFLQPGYKDGVRFINKLYNEGLISPEFSLDADCSKMWSDVANGNVGFFSQNVFSGMRANSHFSALAENVEGAYYLACDPFTNSAGKRPKLSNQPYGKIIMIPAFSEVAVEAMKYIDWMSLPEVVEPTTIGIEGKHFTRDENRVVTRIYDYAGEDRHDAGGGTGLSFFPDGGTWFGNMEDTYLNYWATIPYPEAEAQFNQSMTDIQLDPWFFPYFKQPVLSEGQFGTAMIDKYKEVFTKVFMCTPEEFDALYDQLVDEFMVMYGNEVCEERALVWAATME